MLRVGRPEHLYARTLTACPLQKWDEGLTSVRTFVPFSLFFHVNKIELLLCSRYSDNGGYFR